MYTIRSAIPAWVALPAKPRFVPSSCVYRISSANIEGSNTYHQRVDTSPDGHAAGRMRVGAPGRNTNKSGTRWDLFVGPWLRSYEAARVATMMCGAMLRGCVRWSCLSRRLTRCYYPASYP
eukprot:6933537-Pyramimonas_sp.AAC.2